MPQAPDPSHAATDVVASTDASFNTAAAIPPPVAAPPAAAPPSPGHIGRYRIEGEVGRGGMGAVLRAHDPDLRRDLAVKVLREDYQDDPEAIRRFWEEAQVGGQLQHPGVVPVYELGRLPGQRPYFTMKLVEGRTLVALLAERAAPGQDLPRFLKIFEQVCQTLAYAHSRRVIHRDLKPQNIMVGAFGEVQVMDWGLAKVLNAAGAPGDGASGVRTVRSDAPGLESGAGAVLGTPAYMAPEQAAGAPVDERSDVFGLGALLCEILTGRPPYRGESSMEVLLRAAGADLAEAHARLDGCGADPELVRLAKACLDPDPARRPCDAGAAAAAVTAYLNGVQERLRAAELARAAAQAKTAEERKRRRVTAALAAVGLGLVVVAGGAWLWVTQERAARKDAEAKRLAEENAADRRREEQRAEKTRAVSAALDEAVGLREKARAAPPGDKTRWAEAAAAARRLEGLLDDGEVDETLRARAQALLTDARREIADRHMLALLDEARIRKMAFRKEGDAKAEAASLYAAAFHEDMNLDALEPEAAAAQIAGRAIRPDLTAALVDWALLTPEPMTRARLFRIARAADPDPASFPSRLCAAVEAGEAGALRELAASPEVQRLPPTLLVTLAQGLRLAAPKDPAALRLLQESAARRPDDFWVAAELANEQTLSQAERIRFYTAAVALRPDSPDMRFNFSSLLLEAERTAEAVAQARAGVALDPTDAIMHVGLGRALQADGKLDDAIPEYRAGVNLPSKYALPHLLLGMALKEKGETDEALAQLREFDRLLPVSSDVHKAIAELLNKKGDLKGAEDAYRRYLAEAGDDADARASFGVLLWNEKKRDEGLAEIRKAIELRPKDVFFRGILGDLLIDSGRPDDAEAEFRKAVEVDPMFADGHRILGGLLKKRGQLDEAVAEFRKVVEIRPDDAPAHVDLADVLWNAKNRDESLAEMRKAISLRPGEASYHSILGDLLTDCDRPDEAEAELRKAVELDPKFADAHRLLGVLLRKRGRTDDAIAELQKAVEIAPDRAEAHFQLGMAYQAAKRTDDAVAEFQKAVAARPDHAETHFQLAVALQTKDRSDEALAEVQKAVQLDPAYPPYHVALGAALEMRGRTDEAADEYGKAVELAPQFAMAHAGRGRMLRRQNKPEEAEAELRKAVELQPDKAPYHLTLAQILDDEKLQIEAIAEYRQALQRGPNDAAAHSDLGDVLESVGRHAEAEAEFRKAMALAPPGSAWDCRQLARTLRGQGRFADAADAARRALDLDPKEKASIALVQQLKELREQDALLPAVLAGAAEPSSPAARRGFAVCLQYKQRYGAAARFYAAAFAADPSSADGDRYNAACAAALAGCGRGADAAGLDEAERGRWRKQALAWLRADLATHARRVEGGTADDRRSVRLELRHWRADDDLAGLRDADALDHLPPAERDDCRALWADVDALLKKAAK